MSYKNFKLVENQGFLDLAFENNSLVLIENQDTIAQSIRLIMKTIKGDDQFNRKLGIPYHMIFGQYNEQAIKFFIIDSIFQDPRIKKINDLKIKKLGNLITIDLQLETEKETIYLSEKIRRGS